MLNILKRTQSFSTLFYVFVNRHQKRLLNTARPCALAVNHSRQVSFNGHFHCRNLLERNGQFGLTISRQKSKGRKANVKRRNEEYESDDEDDDDDDDDDDEDEYVEGSATVKTYTLNSLRVDLILKQILNLKRKKVEESFYNNKIRLNGRVVFKKGINVNVGDEIDLIKGLSTSSPDYVDVARIEILKVRLRDDEERVAVKAKKFKNLTIENYPDGDTWKEPAVQTEP